MWLDLGVNAKQARNWEKISENRKKNPWNRFIPFSKLFAKVFLKLSKTCASVKYKYYFYLLTMHPRKITHMMKTWIKWDTRLVFKMLRILKPKILRPVNPSSLIWNCWSQKRQFSDCSTQRSTIFDILFLIKWFKLKKM